MDYLGKARRVLEVEIFELKRLQRELTGPVLPPELGSEPWSPFEIKEGDRAVRLR